MHTYVEDNENRQAKSLLTRLSTHARSPCCMYNLEVCGCAMCVRHSSYAELLTYHVTITRFLAFNELFF